MQEAIRHLRVVLKKFVARAPFLIFLRFLVFEFTNLKPSKSIPVVSCNSFKYFLTAFLIIRNERAYIKEWICFYKLIGVEHFFIFDNNSQDNIEEELTPFFSEKSISFFKINQKPPMPAALYQCIESAWRSKWLISFDVDEFLLEQQGSLVSFLENIDKYPALSVNWRYFGSSGVDDENGKLVIESFLRSQATLNPHVKLIFQPRKLKKAINSHFNLYRDFSCAVDSDMKKVFGTFNQRMPGNRFVLHHYLIGSKKRFFQKGLNNFESIWKGSVLSKRRHPKNWIRESVLYNDVYNDDILKYLAPLKQLLTFYS